MASHYFKIPIPKGYQIYYQNMEVAGAGYHKEAVRKIARSNEVLFDIEPEPTNQHDSNAMKVVADAKGWFFKRRYHIGYLPKEIAEELAGKCAEDVLAPRLKEIWIGDRGGLKVVIDLLGPREQYKQFFESC